jgi:hypothetical protein
MATRHERSTSVSSKKAPNASAPGRGLNLFQTKQKDMKSAPSSSFSSSQAQTPSIGGTVLPQKLDVNALSNSSFDVEQCKRV